MSTFVFHHDRPSLLIYIMMFDCLLLMMTLWYSHVGLRKIICWLCFLIKYSTNTLCLFFICLLSNVVPKLPFFITFGICQEQVIPIVMGE